MKQNNNWCCEITTKTVSLFDFWKNGGNACDINERYNLFFYWEKIELDKKVCGSCQKLWQAEKDKLEKEDEEWNKEWEEELKNRKCANCQKNITIWRYDKKNSENPNWKNEGVLGRSACKKHDDYWCQDKNCSDGYYYQRAFCSLKCLEIHEEKEDKKYWLQKATKNDLYEELEKRR